MTTMTRHPSHRRAHLGPRRVIVTLRCELAAPGELRLRLYAGRNASQLEGVRRVFPYWAAAHRPSHRRLVSPAGLPSDGMRPCAFPCGRRPHTAGEVVLVFPLVPPDAGKGISGARRYPEIVLFRPNGLERFPECGFAQLKAAPYPITPWIEERREDVDVTCCSRRSPADKGFPGSREPGGISTRK